MTTLTDKFADTNPISDKILTNPQDDILAFPCLPRTLAEISKISAIKDIDVRAEQCVFAGITAEHESGRRLLESCSGGTSFYQAICRERIDLYESLQSLAPHELRSLYYDMIIKNHDSEYDDHDCGDDECIYLLCNLLRNDRTVMQQNLWEAIAEHYDAIEIIPCSSEEAPSYAGAARLVRCRLDCTAGFFDLTDQ